MKNEVLNKLGRLQRYVKILNSYKKYSIQDINEDFTLRSAIERYLEVSLECVLDIGGWSYQRKALENQRLTKKS